MDSNRRNTDVVSDGKYNHAEHVVESNDEHYNIDIDNKQSKKTFKTKTQHLSFSLSSFTASIFRTSSLLCLSPTLHNCASELVGSMADDSGGR